MTHVWPVSGVVTQGFGCTGNPYEPQFGSCLHFHPAIDIGAPQGTPIRASAAGKVVAAGWNGIIAAGYPHAGEQAGFGGGNVVIIQHNDRPFYTLYAHMLSVAVQVGHSVAQGQVIGYVDTTGTATGPHLHWGAWDRDLWFTYGTPIDPRRLLAGGDLANNPAFNPPSPVIYVQVAPGVNIRSGPGTNTPVYRKTSTIYISPLKLVFGGWVTGGQYAVNGVYGNTWAKVGLNGSWVFVAKPFIRFV